MPTQLLSTWWFGINSSSPPCSPAFTAQHDVVRFGMSLVTVDELSWLCPHLQTPTLFLEGVHEKQKSWRLGRAVQRKLKNRGSFHQCCLGHKSRTQHQMGCSEQTPLSLTQHRHLHIQMLTPTFHLPNCHISMPFLTHLLDSLHLDLVRKFWVQDDK